MLKTIKEFFNKVEEADQYYHNKYKNGWYVGGENVR